MNQTASISGPSRTKVRKIAFFIKTKRLGTDGTAPFGVTLPTAKNKGAKARTVIAEITFRDKSTSRMTAKAGKCVPAKKKAKKAKLKPSVVAPI